MSEADSPSNVTKMTATKVSRPYMLAGVIGMLSDPPNG
jgi:hypothetical protein